jgi:hypothetical protein
MIEKQLQAVIAKVLAAPRYLLGFPVVRRSGLFRA